MKIVLVGAEELAKKLADLGDVEGILDEAKPAAAERIRDEVASQPWGAGNYQYPVVTGALRDSGRADEDGIYWDDLEYAGVIEARGDGFFRPVVEERGPAIFEEEIVRAVEDLIR